MANFVSMGEMKDAMRQSFANMSLTPGKNNRNDGYRMSSMQGLM